MAKQDSFEIEILDDGTIKMSSDPISSANHSSADAFFKEVARLAGGTTTRQRKSQKSHDHVHGHDHVHSHEG